MKRNSEREDGTTTSQKSTTRRDTRNKLAPKFYDRLEIIAGACTPLNSSETERANNMNEIFRRVS